MRVLILINLVLATASAATIGQRIVGGQLASIAQYPSVANLLQSFDFTFFMPVCAGTIINRRSILTTASCLPSSVSRIRGRVGSSYANSGGTILEFNSLVYSGTYNPITNENDIGLARTVADAIVFVPNAVMPAPYATDATNNVPDNTAVKIVGWGRTEVGHYSEQLREGQVQIMNTRVCENWMWSYVSVPSYMFCTTWSGYNSADVCQGDNGSPIFLNDTVIGIVVLPGCGHYFEPSLSNRVAAFAEFIRVQS